jgi:hypothetical protein
MASPFPYLGCQVTIQGKRGKACQVAIQQIQLRSNFVTQLFFLQNVKILNNFDFILRVIISYSYMNSFIYVKVISNEKEELTAEGSQGK